MDEINANHLKKYIQTHDNIVIYGAGVIGQALYWLIKSFHFEDKVIGFALSPHATQLLDDYEGKKIRCFDQYDAKTCTFMVAVKQEYIMPISQNLEGKEFVYVSAEAIKNSFSDIFDKINPAVHEALEKGYFTTDQYVSACIRQIRRKKLGFGINLADHCNLNCQSCNRFCPIADEYTLPVNEFKKDMERIACLTDHDIEHLDLIGGEPLLNPDIIEIMYAAREIFPLAPIAIDSNGILVLNQSKEFFKALRDNNIRLIMTKYPINLNYDAISRRLDEEEINYSYTVSSTDSVKTTYRLPLIEKGNMDPMQNYLKCWYSNECITVRDGRVFTCPIAAYAHYYNKYFHKDLYVGDRNSISIYDVEGIDEIFEFLKKPIPFCQYCDISGYVFDIPWAVSKKSIEEWM